MSFSNFLEQFFVAVLAFSTLAGLLALISPQAFRSIATRWSTWIDSRKVTDVLDRPFEVDRYILAHSRVFGCVVLGSVSVLTYFYLQH